MNRHDEGPILVVLESSAQERPIWVDEKQDESADYFYFAGVSKTQLKSPQFAYAKARKQLHQFLKEEAADILDPAHSRLLESATNKLTKEWVVFLSRHLMLEVRQTDKVYWEKVKKTYMGEETIHYTYTVLLRLKKEKLRRFQRMFLFRKLDRLKQVNQQLLTRQLEEALIILNKKIEYDKNGM